MRPPAARNTRGHAYVYAATLAKDRTQRFALLRAGDVADPLSGDLFEHFGVPVASDPDPTPALRSAISVLACTECGWLRSTPLVEVCPICAAPARTEASAAPPIADTPGPTATAGDPDEGAG